MIFHSYDDALDRAAELWGIDSEFWDIWGRRHVTSADTKRAILTALGVPADTLDQLQCAVTQRIEQENCRPLPPCLVISENERPREVILRTRLHEAAQVRIRREDGSLQSYDVPPDAAALPLPPDLPLGYHDLEIAAGASRYAMRLIITPDRAWLPEHLRCAGVAVSLYAVRSARNWGCGDLRDLRDLVDWVAGDIGAGFIALNPLHAIHNRRPFNTSPYLPNCVYYRNFIYLDVEAIEDFRNSRRARALYDRPELHAELAALRDAPLVEYERVSALKLRFLKLAFLEFLKHERAGGPRATDFRAYLNREDDLLDRFATYSALDEYLHARDPEVWVWPQWPEGFRDPESPETRAFRQKHWRSVLFYKYVQWQLDLQLAAVQQYARDKGLPIGLYHDLALATDRFGSDLWAHRAFYVSGCRVGSPPDDFSPQGQDWAFPPPHSEQHRATGYRLFAESIRKKCRHGGALRIDHVMRFFRLYWIPDGADATRGAYVRDRYQDLVRIVALESVRQKVIVVGEDLGTVEPFVRETLARFGILSYRLLYFEKNEHGDFLPFHDYPVHALVSATTHDLPTLAGFWSNDDIEARRRAGILDEEAFRNQLAARGQEKQRLLDALFRHGLLPDDFPRAAADVPELNGDLHKAVIGFLASTPSQLMAINQEDLTKETAQQNLPGTTWQYPNWCRKTKFTVEQLRSDASALAFAAMFRAWLARSGRTTRKP